MSSIQQPDIILCPTDTYVAKKHEENVVSTYLKTRALDTGAYVFCSFGDSGVKDERLISAAAYNGKGEEMLVLNDLFQDMGVYFAQRGYVYIAQTVRGCLIASAMYTRVGYQRSTSRDQERSENFRH